MEAWLRDRFRAEAGEVYDAWQTVSAERRRAELFAWASSEATQRAHCYHEVEQERLRVARAAQAQASARARAEREAAVRSAPCDHDHGWEECPVASCTHARRRLLGDPWHGHVRPQ